MSTLGWIITSSLLMSAIALVGSVTLILKEQTLQKILLPLVAFAAGNFLYIGASDLVPEINKHSNMKANLVHFASFSAGIALMWMIKVSMGH